jgi:hypothetical protein
MSQVTLQGNASGTGVFTVAAPNSNTSRTLTLPDATGTVVTTDATQTLTNKSISGAQINSGTVAAARLGSGTPGTGNFLRGDGSWQSIPAPVIPTDFGAVGTYAVLMMAVNTNLATNDTIAGSSLRFNETTNTLGRSDSPGGPSPFYGTRRRADGNSGYDGGGSAPSGTWRKMSTGATYQGFFNFYFTEHYWSRALYVRIS